MANSLLSLVLMACLVVLAIAESTQNAYCNLPKCGPRHTLCKYSLNQASEKCGKISGHLTDDDIKELLAAHNKFRPLIWDQELAVIAQTWANQCDPGLDECRHVERFLVGQSYSYIKTTDPFKAKFSEIVNLSQVHRGTTHVGCGAIRYNPDGNFNTTYLICNYASSV